MPKCPKPIFLIIKYYIDIQCPNRISSLIDFHLTQLSFVKCGTSIIIKTSLFLISTNVGQIFLNFTGPDNVGPVESQDI